MRSPLSSLPCVALVSVFLLLPHSAAAGPVTFNQLVVFGDSLSDNGNAAFALGGTIPGDYAPNAFTDGPNTSPKTNGPFGLWIDQFAAGVGVADPQPFLLNPANTNYAVASAQTGSANPQDVSNQLLAFGSTHPLGAPSNALYVFWAGANDLYNGTSTGKVAADNLATDIQLLAAQGAKNFVWLNLPQLGATPRGAANAAALNAQSTSFDNEWAIDIALLKNAGANVIGVDINSLFQSIAMNPGKFGFANATSPAQGTSADPNTYLFWDTEHPTTAADALVAQSVENAVLGTPEPGSLALLAGGVFAVWLRRRMHPVRRRL